MNNEQKLWTLYKPFRNSLRNYEIIDSMYVIWSYSRNYAFNLPFSPDIELPNGFNPNASYHEKIHYGIPEFELELLLKEVIQNCDLIAKPKNTFKSIGHLSKTINYIRHTLVEEHDNIYKTSDNILLEFNRMAHLQFKWQFGWSVNEILRYYKIYSTESMSKLLQNVFHFNTFQLFLLGFSFFKHTAESYKTVLPFHSSAKVFTDDMIGEFFNHFSISLDDLKDELRENRQINENFFYSYNPLVARPIIIHNNHFICPIPKLMFWQITNGLYYSLINQEGFENAFGGSFESYVGEVISNINNRNKFEVHPEQTYGKEHNKTSDWIVQEKDAILFIECKTKRMTLNAKTNFDIKAGLESDLKKMAKFIVQIYKTYMDYKDNKYPGIPYDDTKLFQPLVVTLEEWYLYLNPKLLDILNSFVLDEFTNNELDQALIKDFPYYIMSADKFEREFQLIEQIGIMEYFMKLPSNCLQDVRKGFVFKELFSGEFQKIFLDPLKEFKN